MKSGRILDLIPESVSSEWFQIVRNATRTLHCMSLCPMGGYEGVHVESMVGWSERLKVGGWGVEELRVR